MTDHDVDGISITTSQRRRDGWAVTYQVEVVFDTDSARTRYDHVGTLARCTCGGHRLDLSGSSAELIGHARAHEHQLSMDHCAGAVSHSVAVTSTPTQMPSGHKEVSPTPTRG